MGENKLVISTEPKPFCFDLPKDTDNNFTHEIYSIKKHNELSIKYTIKNKIRQLLSKYKHGNYVHKHGKQQRLERLDLRSSNKHVLLQNLSICYTWKNMRQQYKNNKLNSSNVELV